MAACETEAAPGTVGGPSPAPGPPPATGGTAAILLPQEPSSLVPLGDDAAVAEQVLEPVLWGAYTQRPDMSYVPQLLDGEAVVSRGPFTVTYRIHPAARWNDGRPVTSADFVATAGWHRDDALPQSSRWGYDVISDVLPQDDKTVRVVFRRPFTHYRELFDPLLPAHAYDPDRRGEWSDSVPVASGPFELDKRERGQIVLKRNENFWGQPAFLDEIVISFGRTDLADALESDRLQLVEVGVDAEAARIVRETDHVVSKALSGPVAEVIELNLDEPPMDDPIVRQALAVAVDRTALTRAVVGGVQPDAQPLQSLVFRQDAAAYRPHFGRYGYDPTTAAELLRGRVCASASGCADAPTVLRYRGDARPSTALQLLAGQLQRVGIQLEPGTRDDWHLGLRRWRLDAGGYRRWVCDDEPGYCNTAVSELMTSSERALSAEESAARRNQADALLAADVPALPLYQHPVMHGWASHLSGVSGNATRDGVLWNAQLWSLATAG